MVRVEACFRSTARLAVVAALTALFCGTAPAPAQGFLGSADEFGVLGASTVTNTGMSTVEGELGVGPGTSITGFPPGIVSGGTMHLGDTVALRAHADAILAYADLVAAVCPAANDLTGQDLGGLGALAPGVYCFSSSAQLTGTLTLDAQSDPNAVFVFQVASTLTTGSQSVVRVINGSTGCNGTKVLWQVGSSATLGTNSTFVGNILALASITLETSATVDGSALAITGAVTMDTNDVTACSSGGPPPPPPTPIGCTGGGQIPVPDANSPDRAVFSFEVHPGATANAPAKGRFNFVDRVTGLHVQGPVTSVTVVATDPNGTPTTLAFAGTCKQSTCGGSGAPCAFAVTVEDHGTPGTNDEFGVTITGGLNEVVTQRVISRGNIRFHKR